MIEHGKIVGMNYVLRDDKGAVLDASEGEPLEFLQGSQNIIAGLEKALNGLKVGDKKKVTVSPEEGYGTYDPQLCMDMERSQFRGEMPKAGEFVQLKSEDGDVLEAKVVSLDDKRVKLDGNHPLAGQTLHFEVEITSVRDASAEELAHGHPHGPHGHGHHGDHDPGHHDHDHDHHGHDHHHHHDGDHHHHH